MQREGISGIDWILGMIAGAIGAIVAILMALVIEIVRSMYRATVVVKNHYWSGQVGSSAIVTTPVMPSKEVEVKPVVVDRSSDGSIDTAEKSATLEIPEAIRETWSRQYDDADHVISPLDKGTLEVWFYPGMAIAKRKVRLPANCRAAKKLGQRFRLEDVAYKAGQERMIESQSIREANELINQATQPIVAKVKRDRPTVASPDAVQPIGGDNAETLDTIPGGLECCGELEPVIPDYVPSEPDHFEPLPCVDVDVATPTEPTPKVGRKSDSAHHTPKDALVEYRGILDRAGPSMFGPQNAKFECYGIELRLPSGGTAEVPGVDLERALKAAKAELGDEVIVRVVDTIPVFHRRGRRNKKIFHVQRIDA